MNIVNDINDNDDINNNIDNDDINDNIDNDDNDDNDDIKKRRFIYCIIMNTEEEIILYADTKKKITDKFNITVKQQFNIESNIKKSRFNNFHKINNSRISQFIKEYKYLPIDEYYKDQLKDFFNNRHKHTKIGDDVYNNQYQIKLLRKEIKRLYDLDEVNNTFIKF